MASDQAAQGFELADQALDIQMLKDVNSKKW